MGAGVLYSSTIGGDVVQQVAKNLEFSKYEIFSKNNKGKIAGRGIEAASDNCSGHTCFFTSCRKCEASHTRHME